MPNNNVTNVDDFACFLQKNIPIKYECDDLDETRKEITSYYVGTIRSVGVGFSGMNISFLIKHDEICLEFNFVKCRKCNFESYPS